MSDQFLLFLVGGRRLAVAVAKVDGVLPPSRVTPMPFVPAWVDGLVMARGVVHVQIDLLAWLTGDRHSSEKYELLQLGTPEGPAVAKVDRVLRLVQGIVRPADQPQLLGLLDVDGEEVAIIDPGRLSFGDVADAEPAPDSAGFIETPRVESRTEITAELTIVVTALGESFALPARRVREVVAITHIEPLPLAPRGLIGLISLRDRVVPLVSLAALLGGAANENARLRAVVVELDDRPIALLVDRIVGLERVGELEEHPLLDEWRGLIGCWMGSQGRVIGLIHLDFLLDPSWHDDMAAFLPSQSGRIAEIPPEPRRLLLTFSVAGHLCAIDAIDVRRVVRWQPPAALPDDSDGIDGVVQIMSDVLPVVDVCTRLGLCDDATGARAFVVARLGGNLAALAIGQPGRIAAVPVSAFHPLGNHQQAGMVDAVARIDGEFAWVLSLAALALDHRVVA